MRQSSLFDSPALPPSFPAERVPGESGAPPPEWVPLSTLDGSEPGPPRRTGIARLAAEAPELDFRNDVDYRELPCKTLIAPVVSERVPFEYSINPYRGCEFGCTYCYARYTHEFMDLENWLDFERKIFVKQGAREALLRDLRRLDLRGKHVAIGTATDPYQPAERRYCLTRSLLELLAGRRGLDLSITTKSDLVARDVDLLQRITEHNTLQVNVTITTPHYELSRRTEPRAPRPDKRLAAVRTLSDAGVVAGVFVMPVLPRINDSHADLDLLIRQAKEAGARYLAAQVLFLRNCSKKRYFPFIDERFPELLPYYHRLYDRRHSEALTTYSRHKQDEIYRIKQRYGLVGFRAARAAESPAPEQLELFEA
jgi:DNA repair photolyase